MKRILFSIALIASATLAFGIGKNTSTVKKAATSKVGFTKGMSAHIGLMNAAITMPTKVLNGTPHYGVEIGFSAPLKKDAKKQRLCVGADAGYFYQNGLQSGTYVKPKLSYKIPVTKKINIEPRIGVGGMVTKNLNNEFKRNNGGDYVCVSPYNTQAMVSVGVQPNIKVFNGKKYNYDAYIRYEFAAQTPFATISSILPITMMQLGMKVSSSNTK